MDWIALDLRLLRNQHCCAASITRNPRGGSKKPANVLLVTKNNQNQIEWYIRSLFFFSRFKRQRSEGNDYSMKGRPTIQEKSLSAYPIAIC